MLLMHNLHDVNLNHIFIVEILSMAKSSILAYIMEVLSFHDLFRIVSLLEAGFGLTGTTLSPSSYDRSHCQRNYNFFLRFFFVVH